MKCRYSLSNSRCLYWRNVCVNNRNKLSDRCWRVDASIEPYIARERKATDSLSFVVFRLSDREHGAVRDYPRILSCLYRWATCNTSKGDSQWVDRKSFSKTCYITRSSGSLEKYPEIKQLMGHDWRMSIQVTISVLIQIATAILIRDQSWLKLIFVAYIIGGTINHTLSLALHELTHNLAFGHSRPMCNRLLGFFANLPLGVPASITLKKYHLDHHR